MRVLARNWWALALRGALAILFGILAIVWPGLTLTALVILFGAYALADGVFAIIAFLRGDGFQEGRWPLLVEGIVGVIAGILVIVWPGLSALALLFVIAGWSIVTGIFEIAAAVALRREIENEWLLGLGGLVSVIFGILIAIFPGEGALALAWIIGIYAIVFGVLFIGLALRLHSIGKGHEPTS